jgi:hypothetical protein
MMYLNWLAMQSGHHTLAVNPHDKMEGDEPWRITTMFYSFVREIRRGQSWRKPS